MFELCPRSGAGVKRRATRRPQVVGGRRAGVPANELGSRGGYTKDPSGAVGIARLATTIFGIRNCDTMKKARAWLDGHGVDYTFHDYKVEGIDAAHLQRWAAEIGWQTVLNRGGTTFRKLPDVRKTGLDERKAIALMLEQPSMIRRPVLEVDNRILVGFTPAEYASAFASRR
jgi:Spx/MgsR family transcriptional regulator